MRPPPPDLRLRPLRGDDEAAALAAHAELAADGFPFLLDHDPQRPWADHVRLHADLRAGRDLPPDRVRAAFLLATVEGEVVGRSSLRFTLNEYLRTQGGHVGYGVRPAWRGRGCAGEVLRQSLVVLRAEGVEEVLVTCGADNAASAAVIVRGGGREVDPWTAPDGAVTRRFLVA